MTLTRRLMIRATFPGAVGWNWTSQLNDQLTRDILSAEQMGELLGESGIGPDTTVVLYGDNNNWFATYAFWQMRDIRPFQPEDHGRRQAEVARRGPGTDHRGDLCGGSFELRRACARSLDKGHPRLRSQRRIHQQQYRPGGRSRAGGVQMALFSRPPICRRKAHSEAATYLARPTYPGRPPSPRTALSSLSRNSRPYTAARASRATARPSPTAGSVNEALTPGSCCPRFWATRRSATTMAHGRSTAP